jgi:transcriptional regulator with PAS, ATPase and Fis domain
MDIPWLNTLPVAITVSDKDGKIIEMNEQSANVFSKYGGYDLIGKQLNNCHSKRSQEIIASMLKNGTTNAYTIEKEGKRKLICQAPWYIDNEPAGLVELSFVLPDSMPHYIR